MGAVEDIKANLDLDQVAQLLGTNPDEANVLVDEALASLVGQLDNNVSDAAGAASLTRALDPRRCGPDVIRDCRLKDAVMEPVR